MKKFFINLLLGSSLIFVASGCINKQEVKPNQSKHDQIIEVIKDLKEGKNIIRITENNKIETNDFRLILLYKIEKENVIGVKYKVINITDELSIASIENVLKNASSDIIASYSEEDEQNIYIIYSK